MTGPMTDPTTTATADLLTAAVNPPPHVAGPAHLGSLDALRGVAILCVLACHCTYVVYHDVPYWRGLWVARDAAHQPPSYLLFWPLSLGWCGVSLFFVLSGWLIHYSYLRARGPFSLGQFYWKRFWRIIPPYWLALVGYTLVVWKLGDPDKAGLPLGRQFAVHLLCVQNFFRSGYFAINPSFWSLAIEVQFYLLYPLLLVSRRAIGPGRTLLAVLAVSTAARGVHALSAPWHGEFVKAAWWNLDTLWFDWALGMYLAERFAAGRPLFRRHKLWAIGLAVAFVAANLTRPTVTVAFTVASLLGAVLVEASLHSTRPPGRLWRGLQWLSLGSYSFYLWHQPLLRPIARVLRLTHLRPWIELPCLAAVSLAALSVASYGLYLAVERPSQRAGRRLWDGFARRPQSTPG